MSKELKAIYELAQQVLDDGNADDATKAMIIATDRFRQQKRARNTHSSAVAAPAAAASSSAVASSSAAAAASHPSRSRLPQRGRSKSPQRGRSKQPARKLMRDEESEESESGESDGDEEGNETENNENRPILASSAKKQKVKHRLRPGGYGGYALTSRPMTSTYKGVIARDRRNFVARADAESTYGVMLEDGLAYVKWTPPHGPQCFHLIEDCVDSTQAKQRALKEHKAALGIKRTRDDATARRHYQMEKQTCHLNNEEAKRLCKDGQPMGRPRTAAAPRPVADADADETFDTPEVNVGDMLNGYRIHSLSGGGQPSARYTVKAVRRNSQELDVIYHDAVGVIYSDVLRKDGVITLTWRKKIGAWSEKGAAVDRRWESYTFKMAE